MSLLAEIDNGDTIVRYFSPANQDRTTMRNLALSYPEQMIGDNEGELLDIPRNMLRYLNDYNDYQMMKWHYEQDGLNINELRPPAASADVIHDLNNMPFDVKVLADHVYEDDEEPGIGLEIYKFVYVKA